MLGLGALLTGCGSGSGPDSTTPRVISETLVAIVPTTTAPNPTAYTIQQGDTLTAIAGRFHLDVAELAAANGITDVDDIEAGQSLTIPPNRPLATAAP